MTQGEAATSDPGPVEAFWNLAKFHAKLNVAPTYFGPTTLEVVPPPAWSFGNTPEEADELLAMVLNGTKTATASALRDYTADGEQLPQKGTLGILLDGAGNPRVLIATTDVAVVPFDEVDAEHARREGEGDLTLAHWREANQQFFTETGPEGAGFDPTMEVVLEQFEIVYEAD